MGNVPKPNIQWRGAHPNNFTVGRPGGGLDGRNTNHHVVGSAESAVLVFNNGSRGASSHLVITDRPDIAAFQCVDFANTAWCDGNWQSNLRTISMEHHGDWRNGYRNEQVIENSAKVVAWLRDQGLVNRPIRHREVSQAGTICPADLPVEEIWDRATQLINRYNQPPAQPEWMKNRREVPVRTLYNQKEVTWVHNLNAPGSPLDDRRFARNQDFYIKGETVAGGIEYWITASSFDGNVPAGIAKYDLADKPWSPPTQPEPPKPTTPDWADALIKNDRVNETLYVLRATPLIDLENGRPFVKDGKEIWYQAGDIVENVSTHTIVNEVMYQVTEYSLQETKKGNWKAANGILGKDLTNDPKACPPGTPANPLPPEEPEDPVEPMPDVPTKDDEQDAKINGIMDLLKVIGDAIAAFLAKFKK